MKHTPGPWKSTPYSSIVGCVIMASHTKTKTQFNIAAIMGGSTEGEIEANAKLIAAAPELLEQLLIAREYMKTFEAIESKLKILDDVIKKATT